MYSLPQRGDRGNPVREVALSLPRVTSLQAQKGDDAIFFSFNPLDHAVEGDLNSFLGL